MRRQFETNVFGLLRLTQLVLPGMRAAGAGKIVNVSSMGGRLTFPGGGAYHATKYAVEALSDALRMEVARFGIDVICIEPGLIRTEFGATAAGACRPPTPTDPYAEFNAVGREVHPRGLRRPVLTAGRRCGRRRAGDREGARQVTRADARARHPVGAHLHGHAPRAARPRVGQGRRRVVQVSLDRFVEAQDRVWPSVLAELRAGRKTSHWMWFVFPQLTGLGRSPMSVKYAIADVDEARALPRPPGARPPPARVRADPHGPVGLLGVRHLRRHRRPEAALVHVPVRRSRPFRAALQRRPREVFVV